ncbi:MAG: hypothetical protein IPI08_06270 [Betaproteobacteria bacterium]|nr:hypothetical protein [Betaproteobacteria bacterium]
MTYAYGAANSFNYIDFYNDRFSLDLSQRLIEFRVKGENHPPNTVALQLYSTSTNGFLQYDLTASDLDGEWRHLSLSLGRFSSYGTNPDLQAIDLVRFRAIGDAGARHSRVRCWSMIWWRAAWPSPAACRWRHWHWPLPCWARRAGVARGRRPAADAAHQGGAGSLQRWGVGVSGLAFRRGAVLFACGGGCLTCPSPACQQRRPGPG